MFQGRLRKQIQALHLAFDGWVGRLNPRQPSLGALSKVPHTPVKLADFSNYAYSRMTHFKEFAVMPRYTGQSPSTCDLKVYQDICLYNFIKDNFPQGSRLLEIGGGRSRIIAALKNDYEIWNLDKLEGQGHGPKALWGEDGFRLVRGYIGDFSPELPDGHFDLVFSISTVEHFPRDPVSVDAILQDVQRLLRPGGYSIHAVDGLLYLDSYFIHPLVTTAHERGWITYPEVTFTQLKADPDLWLMPRYAFYTRWFPLVKKRMNGFGSPFSINVMWKKK